MVTSWSKNKINICNYLINCIRSKSNAMFSIRRCNQIKNNIKTNRNSCVRHIHRKYNKRKINSQNINQQSNV